MTDYKIKFGTDGWRAVIGEGFTFANLELVTRATARWLKKNYGNAPRVVIGYDTRFLGKEFSQSVARVFADEGITSILSSTFTTTPAVSWAAKEFGCNAGIVITASHNPPKYSGFKIKADFGGPATPEMIDAVEDELSGVAIKPINYSFEDYVAAGRVELKDLSSEFKAMLSRSIDLESIKASGIRIAHDAMFGAGQGFFSSLLDESQVVELHADWNPGFHGNAPEPIEKNLAELVDTVVKRKCDVGIANDGDADRIGMTDEKGEFVSSHLLLALLVKYLHTEKGLTGGIVKTFSTTHMLDKMGKAYGLPVDTTKIGFKYIASKIVEGDVLVGGEESGGMAVKGHIPERDGVYIGLLMLEMMVRREKKLSELVDELYDEFGSHYWHRVDVHTTEAAKQKVLKRLKEDGGLTAVDRQAVVDFQTLDGYKHITDHGWLLVRPSGTEPVLRVYSEAQTQEKAVGLVEDAIKQLGV
ncbi:MAG: phosphoglucomutase/phosphomannomutase family protein [Bacteroidetes bacterium]|nr:phosphoglucomutase/phosphomannomutase family protein [Bacteroidota bacterium]